MTNRSIILRSLLCASLLSATALPVRADVNEGIRQSMEDDCRRQGGRFSYPRCYLPDNRPNASEQEADSCDGWCTLGTSIAVIIAARIAYCRANPGKCR